MLNTNKEETDSGKAPGRKFYNTSQDPALIEARKNRALRAAVTRRANKQKFLDAYYAKKALEAKAGTGEGDALRGRLHAEGCMGDQDYRDCTCGQSDKYAVVDILTVSPVTVPQSTWAVSP